MSVTTFRQLIPLFVLSIAPPVDVGFIQESYTVTEGERVILTYSFLSEFVVVNVVTFVVFDIEVIPGTASGRCCP